MIKYLETRCYSKPRKEHDRLVRARNTIREFRNPKRMYGRSIRNRRTQQIQGFVGDTKRLRSERKKSFASPRIRRMPHTCSGLHPIVVAPIVSPGERTFVGYILVYREFFAFHHLRYSIRLLHFQLSYLRDSWSFLLRFRTRYRDRVSFSSIYSNRRDPDITIEFRSVRYTVTDAIP